MKECCGDREELKKLGKIKKNSYTIEQMIDNTLKCTGGESFLEVETRMNEAVEDIVKNNIGKNVVIVSHAEPLSGATPTGYYLKKYCDFKNNKLLYKEKEINIASPSILKLEFEELKLKEIIFR